MKAEIRGRVMGIFREFFSGSESDSEILKINPNSFDMDPGEFYEMLIDEFNLHGSLDDSDDALYSGLGGKISATIKFIDLHYKEKPSQASAPFEQISLLFGNIELGLRHSDSMNEVLKSCLDMFKYELRSEYKQLKKEAAGAIKSKQFDKVIKIAREEKVKGLKVKEVVTILEVIVNF